MSEKRTVAQIIGELGPVFAMLNEHARIRFDELVTYARAGEIADDAFNSMFSLLASADTRIREVKAGNAAPALTPAPAAPLAPVEVAPAAPIVVEAPSVSPILAPVVARVATPPFPNAVKEIASTPGTKKKKKGKRPHAGAPPIEERTEPHRVAPGSMTAMLLDVLQARGAPMRKSEISDALRAAGWRATPNRREATVAKLLTEAQRNGHVIGTTEGWTIATSEQAVINGKKTPVRVFILRSLAEFGPLDNQTLQRYSAGVIEPIGSSSLSTVISTALSQLCQLGRVHKRPDRSYSITTAGAGWLEAYEVQHRASEKAAALSMNGAGHMITASRNEAHTN